MKRLTRLSFLLSIAAAVSGLLLIVSFRVWGTGDISSLLAVGTDYPRVSSAVIADIPDVYLYSDMGHDGSQFYIIAQRFPDIRDAAPNLDIPTLRLRRILMPVLLSPFFGRSYITAYVGLMVLAAGLGAWALWRLGGRQMWMGAGFALSPAVIHGVQFGLADPLALALGLAGIATRKRGVLPVILLTAAVLTRETLLIAAFAAAVGEKRMRLVLVPAAAALAWNVALIGMFGGSMSQGQFAPPFTAWWSLGGNTPFLIAGLTGAGIWAAWRLWSADRSMALWVIGELVVLSLISTPIVRGGNWVRAAPVIIPAVVLALGNALRKERAGGEGIEGEGIEEEDVQATQAKEKILT